MINWSYIIARLISAIGSWLDSSNLRNHVYKLKEENEIMRTALEDMMRMDRGGKMSEYAKKTLDTVGPSSEKF